MLINQKKDRTCRQVNFAIPADHKGKIKESEKIDKYLDLAEELKVLVEYVDNCDTSCSWYTWKRD